MRKYFAVKSRLVSCLGFKNERRIVGVYVLNTQRRGKHKFILEYKGLASAKDVMVRLFFPSGTPLNFTTFFTTFAGDNMPRYASICRDMPFYPYLASAIPVD